MSVSGIGFREADAAIGIGEMLGEMFTIEGLDAGNAMTLSAKRLQHF